MVVEFGGWTKVITKVRSQKAEVRSENQSATTVDQVYFKLCTSYLVLSGLRGFLFARSAKLTYTATTGPCSPNCALKTMPSSTVW